MNKDTQVKIGTAITTLTGAYSIAHVIAFHQFGQHAKSTCNLLAENQPLGDRFIDIPNTRAIRNIQGWSPSWRLTLQKINDKTTRAYGNRTFEYWNNARHILHTNKNSFIFIGLISMIGVGLGLHSLFFRSKSHQRVDTNL